MVQQSKDLFDDSTMSFGEHLEELRVHLFKAIVGATIAIVLCLIKGEDIVAFVRAPIDSALAAYSDDEKAGVDVKDDVSIMEGEWWETLLTNIREFFENLFSSAPDDEAAEAAPEAPPDERKTAIRVSLTARDLLFALHQADPETYAAPGNDAEDEREDSTVNLTLVADEFAQFKASSSQTLKPVTLNVQEAFMTYLKVSLVAGLVLASPWIFYQVWLFVAAGLYKHERKFVYSFGAMSLVLFITGAAFCFYAVFPFVLNFLLAFNRAIGVTPQIRLSEWVSFAVMLPLMFGISFQLPLVMKFLSAISLFDVDAYRSKRRLAILVIAFLSMILTPADPASMLLMMFPLILLYELGILLCKFGETKNPYETEPA
ncbi:MAG: twin-arginine translocase subunit TatC [Planctomycetota bacterium]|nr:MAG: twin-arginine translocase subunit TatC [Planctomycetota bacterium]